MTPARMSSDQDRHPPLRTASTGAVLAAVAVLVLARALAFGAGADALALRGLRARLDPRAGCVVRAVRTSEGDLVRDLAESAFVGWLLLGAAFLGAPGARLRTGIAAWPAVAVGAAQGWRARKDAPPRGDAGLARGPLLRARGARAARRRSHARRSAERVVVPQRGRLHVPRGQRRGARARVPVREPRLAGAPFAYRVFAYAPIARRSASCSGSRSRLYFRVGVQFLPFMLPLLVVFDAAHAREGSAWAGVIAAALLVLHLDVGRACSRSGRGRSSRGRCCATTSTSASTEAVDVRGARDRGGARAIRCSPGSRPGAAARSPDEPAVVAACASATKARSRRS